MRRVLPALVLSALAGTGVLAATPAPTDPPSLAGTTTLIGTGSASMLVTVPSETQVVTSGSIQDAWMDVDAPDGVTVGFMLEAQRPHAYPSVGIELPDGYGLGGGPLEMDYVDREPMSPGAYRVYLLSDDPDAEVSLTLQFEGLTGTTTLGPTTPAALVVRADERPLVEEVEQFEQDDVVITKRIAATNGVQETGGYFISGWAFRGDPGSTVRSQQCSMTRGAQHGELSYQLPACVPFVAGGSGGSFTSYGGFVPIFEGAYAFLSHGGLIPAGEEIGVNTAVEVVGDHYDSHAFAVWIDRGDAGPRP